MNRFNYTAYTNKDKTIQLVFGCESHPLIEWRKLHDVLAARHREKQGAKWTRAVARFVTEYFKEAK